MSCQSDLWIPAEPRRECTPSRVEYDQARRKYPQRINLDGSAGRIFYGCQCVKGVPASEPLAGSKPVLINLVAEGRLANMSVQLTKAIVAATSS